MACLSHRLRRCAILAWYSTACCHSQHMWISSLDDATDNFTASEAVAGFSTTAPPPARCTVSSFPDWTTVTVCLLVLPLTTWTNYNVSSTARLLWCTATDVPTTSPWFYEIPFISYVHPGVNRLQTLRHGVQGAQQINTDIIICLSCVYRLLSLFRSRPMAWNALPADIRSSTTITEFKQKLKTHLFGLSYPDT